MFNTKDHRSSNIMIDPQLLSFGTFDQKADLPLPRSSSPKKMEERSKSPKRFALFPDSPVQALVSTLHPAILRLSLDPL